MTQELAPVRDETLEKLIVDGDLSRLTPRERVAYVTALCKSLGLNPLTRPFGLIRLQGQLKLYAFRECSDQLRRVHKI
ncbi:MAG: hypothetical protein C4289_10270, partial [Chloroflexota bacterium]